MNVKLYQLRRDLDNFGDLFHSEYSELKKIIDFKRNLKNFYELKYELDINNNNKDTILDDISIMFSTQIPADFNGHRLAVSDVIIIDDTMLIKDTYGFQDIK